MTERDPLRLEPPAVGFQESYLAALVELAAEGNAHFLDLVVPAEAGFPGVRFDARALRDPTTFAQFCSYTRALALEETPRPRDWVTGTYLWMVSGQEVVGRISFRHELTPWLLEMGGHIGYAVRPGARRRGHATRAVTLMLPICRERGLAQVLITCDDDNVGSRLAIERNGGVLEDVRNRKMRFWVPTAPG